MRHLAAAALLAAAAAATGAASAGTAAGATAAPASAGVTIYAAGDIARCPRGPQWSGAADTAATVAAGLARDPAALVLALGDTTYPRGAMAEFTDCYGPTWGRFKDRTWPAPGNHEYATAEAAPYFAYFGARAARGWYSFDAGSWHIVSLDSNLGPARHPERHAEQLAWLRADLAAHPARCTLAFWHHPLYTSGGHGAGTATMRAAWALLADAGAELVLSGHDHDYERFAPQDADGRLDRTRGVRQFVVGTGGAYPTPFLRTMAHSEARDSGRTGVLRLRLYDGGYDWEFLESSRITDLGLPPPDRGHEACH